MKYYLSRLANFALHAILFLLVATFVSFLTNIPQEKVLFFTVLSATIFNSMDIDKLKRNKKDGR